MTPHAAQRTAQHARRLLTAHIITPHDYAILDALLWRCRRPGRADLVVTYAAVARLAGVCRDTAIDAVRKLAQIGIITKLTRRVLVRWGPGRSLLASRQAANCYVFRSPDTESPAPAADKGRVRIQAHAGSPQPPIRTVEEQIRMLNEGEGAGDHPPPL